MFDVIFICCDEPGSEDNWDNLKLFVPWAQRVDNVKGICEAHFAAAKKVASKHFFVVDGDCLVHENFKPYYDIKVGQENYVHIWKSHNPVNGLEYGYGAVKMFPKNAFNKSCNMLLDFTTSISDGIILIDEVTSTTYFNLDPYNAWKGAFRECVKLSSGLIKNSVNEENIYRLDTWCNEGKYNYNGQYVIDGANQGKIYGTKYYNNIQMLKKINDYNWLHEQFNDRNGYINA